MGWRRVLCLCSMLLAPRAAAGDEPAYVWPLDTDPVLTSSFGEPRSTHLHAGIDLSTGGRTGVACRAVGDGSVVRLRMSPFGYGKALYVQLDAGPLVVYAHLSRFTEPMAQRAWQEQVKRGRYTFDVSLPPGSLPVRRGEIVAWSGDTGVGWPHLHFEVRDGDVARNPQTAGFALRDPVPPTIRAVEIVPLHPEAHVEGSLDAWVIEATATTRAVRLGGRVGFAVRAIDRAGPGSYQQAPYRYTIRIDGRTLFEAEHERFDYAVNHHIVLDYDQEQLHKHDARFFWLFARAGNGLPGRQAAASGRGTVIAGIPEAAGLDDPSFLVPGRHEVEIEVRDVAGQKQTWRFPVWASQKPVIEDFRGEMRDDSLFVWCRARDADGDSLTARLALSADGGTTWRDVSVGAAPGETASWTWTARVAWKTGDAVALRARVEDPAGLQALATRAYGIESAAAPQFTLTRRTRHGRLEIEAESSTLLEAPPALSLHGEKGSRATYPEPVQTAERRYRWALDLDDLDDYDEIVVSGLAGTGAVGETRRRESLRLVRRGRARSIDDLHPQLRLDFDKHTLFESIGLWVEDVDPRRLRPGPELEPAGPCVRIEPRTAALDGRLRLRLPLPETQTAGSDGAGNAGVFRVDAGGGFDFLGAERTGAGELVAETRRLGTFLVLRDTRPPRVESFRAVPRRGRPPRLEFVAVDGGAGLGDQGIAVRIDGKRAIPEWDPETGRVIVHPTGDLAPGVHHLQVEAEDRLGNGSERTWEFRLP